MAKCLYLYQTLFSMIVVKHKRTRPDTIKKKYPDAVIIDVTSKSKTEYVKFSPFYPHRGIPVPFSHGITAACVEGIWQGLKVFETGSIDVKMFYNDKMKNVKRSTRKYGSVLGHRRSVYGSDHQLLDYIQARKLIYMPSYLWVLENKLGPLVNKLRKLSEQKTVVLLDYNTNPDIENPTKPLSHAALIKAYIDGNYPKFDIPEGTRPLNVGQWVVHDIFGPGEVVKIEGIHAEVRFSKDVLTFDQYGDSLTLVTKDHPFISKETSRGITATLYMNEFGHWGVMPNPEMKQNAIPCEYDEICFYAARAVYKQKVPILYFIVKKDGLWGLLSKQGTQQASCIYDKLTPKEKDYYFIGFEYHQGLRTGMINGKGEEI